MESSFHNVVSLANYCEPSRGWRRLREANGTWLVSTPRSQLWKDLQKHAQPFDEKYSTIAVLQSVHRNPPENAKAWISSKRSIDKPLVQYNRRTLEGSEFDDIYIVKNFSSNNSLSVLAACLWDFNYILTVLSPSEFYRACTFTFDWFRFFAAKTFGVSATTVKPPII